MRYLLLLMLSISTAYATPTEFTQGVQIGPVGATLPIYNFDEWVTDPVVIGELAPGEVKTIQVTGISTIFPGATVLARPLNPQYSLYNFDKLTVKYAWIDFEPNTVNIMVKNDSEDTVTFGEDGWVVTYWNTNDISVYLEE